MAAIRQSSQTNPPSQVPVLCDLAPDSIANLDRRRCACASETRILAWSQNLKQSMVPDHPALILDTRSLPRHLEPFDCQPFALRISKGKVSILRTGSIII